MAVVQLPAPAAAKRSPEVEPQDPLARYVFACGVYPLDELEGTRRLRARTSEKDARSPQAPFGACAQTALGLHHDVVIGPRQGPTSWELKPRRHYDKTMARLQPAVTLRYRALPHTSPNACCYRHTIAVRPRSQAESFPEPRFHPKAAGYREEIQCLIRKAPERGADEAECPPAVDFGGGPERNHAAALDPAVSRTRTAEARRQTGFEDLDLCGYRGAVHHQVRRDRPW